MLAVAEQRCLRRRSRLGKYGRGKFGESRCGRVAGSGGDGPTFGEQTQDRLAPAWYRESIADTGTHQAGHASADSRLRPFLPHVRQEPMHQCRRFASRRARATRGQATAPMRCKIPMHQNARLQRHRRPGRATCRPGEPASKTPVHQKIGGPAVQDVPSRHRQSNRPRSRAIAVGRARGTKTSCTVAPPGGHAGQGRAVRGRASKVEPQIRRRRPAAVGRLDGRIVPTDCPAPPLGSPRHPDPHSPS